jgi:hypothetical protein
MGSDANAKMAMAQRAQSHINTLGLLEIEEMWPLTML